MSSKAVETVYGSMPSHLSCASLKDLCLDGGIQTGPFGSQLHQEDYVESGIPIITVEHLGENRIIHSNLPQVSDQDKARLSKYVLKAGDIVFSRVGSVDRRALVQPAEDGWLFSGRCLRVRPNAEKLDAQWLSYFFGLPAFKNYIRGIAVGATMPSLNTKILSDVPIYFPDLNAQKDAASILSIIDDRITLLRETNQTIEAIAQGLFKSWFVDFDPVRAKAEGKLPEGIDSATAALFPDAFDETELGLVPRGWQICSLASVSDVGIGKTPPRKEAHWFSESPQDVRWVSIRDMGSSGAYISSTTEYLTAEAVEKFNVRRIPDKTVLLSFKMTIGRVSITDGEMTTNEAIAHCKLTQNSPVCSEYIYLHLKQFDYASLSSTSSIADAVNSKTVKAIPILVPSIEVHSAFKKLTDVLFEKIKNNHQQTQALVTLRDTLLSRLISGQLRIADAEAELEKAIA